MPQVCSNLPANRKLSAINIRAYPLGTEILPPSLKLGMGYEQAHLQWRMTAMIIILPISLACLTGKSFAHWSQEKNSCPMNAFQDVYTVWCRPFEKIPNLSFVVILWRNSVNCTLYRIHSNNLWPQFQLFPKRNVLHNVCLSSCEVIQFCFVFIHHLYSRGCCGLQQNETERCEHWYVLKLKCI